MYTTYILHFSIASKITNKLQTLLKMFQRTLRVWNYLLPYTGHNFIRSELYHTYVQEI